MNSNIEKSKFTYLRLKKNWSKKTKEANEVSAAQFSEFLTVTPLFQEMGLILTDSNVIDFSEV